MKVSSELEKGNCTWKPIPVPACFLGNVSSTVGTDLPASSDVLPETRGSQREPLLRGGVQNAIYNLLLLQPSSRMKNISLSSIMLIQEVLEHSLGCKTRTSQDNPIWELQCIHHHQEATICEGQEQPEAEWMVTPPGQLARLKPYIPLSISSCNSIK